MFDKINLSLSFNPLFFFIALILLGAYSFYVYKYTIPKVSNAKKNLLIVLRVLALLLLIFIIFEPTLSFAKKTILEPVNLIFADNSRSIKIKDGTKREETIKSFLNEAKKNNLFENSELFSFGSKIEKVNPDSLEKINFSEGSSNFSQIFSGIKNNSLKISDLQNETYQNISSIIIISDGEINEGSNPLYTAEKLNIPVFTIGVGDTTKQKDVEIKNVLYNEYIYTGTPTTISASILNNGFTGKNINAALYENDSLVAQKNIKLNNDVENVDFTYNPKTGGEKKLTVTISNLDKEFTFANNKKVFYVNVLGSKIKVLLIAGAPSADLSFIKNSLRKDENIIINSFTQIAKNSFLEKDNNQSLIDSADIFFLIGFPTNETSIDFLRKITNELINKSKPFFITLSSQTDFQKLDLLQNVLPFSVSNAVRHGYAHPNPSNQFEVQPNISNSQIKNPLIQNNSQNLFDAWNNLPPVFQPNADYKAKPESEIISKEKINNIPVNNPLIVSRKLGSKRSIGVLAGSIWKWKLQTAENNLDLFDRFILNSVKWLNTSDKQKQVTIKSSKKIYALGDDVDFTAQVYDESFNPVSDAEVNLIVTGGKERYELKLNSVGSGLYEGTLQLNKSGDFSFAGLAKRDGKNIGTDYGKFNIGEVDVEMLNPRMNYELLNLLANQTNGKFFYNKNYSDLFPILKNLNQKSSREKLNVSEISLWSNEWLMAIAVLFFALEWFFRKRFGML